MLFYYGCYAIFQISFQTQYNNSSTAVALPALMNMYESAWKDIVQPVQIKSKKHMLGPIERTLSGVKIVRKDLEVSNRNNKIISAFLFHCPQLGPNYKADQTVIYLHGNGGSKLQALAFVPLMGKFNINIVAFDFLGCGCSDSETLTYGINEVFDIRDVLQEVRKYTPVERVTLWGRSMGALCAIMFAEMYSYEVNGLILDSPFRSLSSVVDRIAAQSVPIPEILLKPIVYLVKKRAAQQANYDIFSIDYLNVFKKLNTNMPILFIFSHFDGIVPAEEVFEFYNSYKGPKDLCQIYQTHDEDRTEDLFNQGMMWLKRTKRKNIEGLVQAREHMYESKDKDKNKPVFC